MDAAAWLAEFARRERDYLTWRDEEHSRVRKQAQIKVEPRPVVLKTWEADEDDLPTSAQRVAARAAATGWATRVVASTAAIPSSGLVNVVTVRARRHDERLWAAWRNGGFECAWYVGLTGLESLSWDRLSTSAKRAQTAADRAAAKATVIPYAIGPSSLPKPVTTRGVLDVIEGVRGPKQWIDLLERQEMDRAVQVLRDASLGPMIVT